MRSVSSLPTELNLKPGTITVVLFSLSGCEFCAEIRERYLRPVMTSNTQPIVIAEADIESSASIRDWRRHDVQQRAFARESGARFAPTVMFFDWSGKSVAEPIVGLSKDFFGAYLEQRLRVALHASKATHAI